MLSTLDETDVRYEPMNGIEAIEKYRLLGPDESLFL
jgi:hypothetical protein